ncbi:hypothetical protein [Marinobacter nauticus]|uniref:hypothetical protein n=1 Tax=Marinobacter nauticus TaxID=2743 RepID=UPI0005A0A3DA|nr:hypothetical protein [Marinobacter nauticus]
MQRYVLGILEFIGLAGIIGLIAYINWTKIALGAVMAAIGAFFPDFRRLEVGEEQEHGAAKLIMLGAKFTINGTARFGVVLVGIILVIGGATEGVNPREIEQDIRIKVHKQLGGSSHINPFELMSAEGIPNMEAFDTDVKSVMQACRKNIQLKRYFGASFFLDDVYRLYSFGCGLDDVEPSFRRKLIREDAKLSFGSNERESQ